MISRRSRIDMAIRSSEFREYLTLLSMVISSNTRCDVIADDSIYSKKRSCDREIVISY